MALINPRINPIPNLIGTGENTQSQDQLITDVTLSMTNNAVNRIANKLFFISRFLIVAKTIF